MNKTEAAAGGGHAEVENVDRECLSIVTFPGNMTHILLEFIPSSRGVDGEMDLNEEAGKENESHQRYSDLLSVRWFSRPS